MQETLYTVKEDSKIFRTNPSYVYKLIEADSLEVLNLRSLKIKKSSVDKFLEYSVGKDLSDPFNIKILNDKNFANKEVTNDRAC